MNRFIWPATLTSFLLAGCFQSGHVDVRITPDSYQAGEVGSALATPVVDEVVRIEPGKVLIMVCRGTPQGKVIQFHDELRARLQAKIEMTFADDGCA